MKKNLLSFITTFCFFITVSGSENRINLYGGYVLDDKFDSYKDAYNYFDGKIKGGLQFGFSYEFFLPVHNGFELMYIGQRTNAPTKYYPNGSTTPNEERTKDLDLDFNYILGGYNRYFSKENRKREGYIGLSAGVLLANAKDPESGEKRDAVKFSWGAKVGANFWLSEKFGIKIQSQLLSTVQTAGGTLYFGSGGYGPGTTTASSMLQLSFSTGVVYKLGRKHVDE
jgi:hypothetical protein